MIEGLVWVETGAWGGLSLTFIISFFCLIFCFPIGMALALGMMPRLINKAYEKYGKSILVFFGGLIFAAGVNNFL